MYTWCFTYPLGVPMIVRDKKYRYGSSTTSQSLSLNTFENLMCVCVENWELVGTVVKISIWLLDQLIQGKTFLIIAHTCYFKLYKSTMHPNLPLHKLVEYETGSITLTHIYLYRHCIAFVYKPLLKKSLINLKTDGMLIPYLLVTLLVALLVTKWPTSITWDFHVYGWTMI